MKRLTLSAVIGLTFSCSAFAYDPQQSLKLEYRFSDSSVPLECESNAAIAQKDFEEKWAVKLNEPVKTEVVESSEDPEGKDRKYLAPVGSNVVFLTKRQISGKLASLFINCRSREAYVLARGGIVDTSSWYGPFQF